LGLASGDRNRGSRHTAARLAQYYGLLILAVALLNYFFYWESGSLLSLAVGIIATLVFVGWLAYTRSVLRGISGDANE
jgi:FtsH-binding integral membrane protein